jgi:hypothetical protein
MSFPESPISAPAADPAEALHSLQQAYLSLRAMFHALLIIVLVLTGSLNIFLWKQVNLVRIQVAERNRYLSDFQKNKLPVMNEFLTKVQEFARTDTNFAKILLRYGKPAPAVASLPHTPGK